MTYLNFDHKQTPPGYICRTQGLEAPVELCREGYYCEPGAKVDSDQKKCPEGYFCLQGKVPPHLLKSTGQSVANSDHLIMIGLIFQLDLISNRCVDFINFLNFIVCDSILYSAPLVFLVGYTIFV